MFVRTLTRTRPTIETEWNDPDQSQADTQAFVAYNVLREESDAFVQTTILNSEDGLEKVETQEWTSEAAFRAFKSANKASIAVAVGNRTAYRELVGITETVEEA